MQNGKEDDFSFLEKAGNQSYYFMLTGYVRVSVNIEGQVVVCGHKSGNMYTHTQHEIMGENKCQRVERLVQVLKFVLSSLSILQVSFLEQMIKTQSQISYYYRLFLNHI